MKVAHQPRKMNDCTIPYLRVIGLIIDAFGELRDQVEQVKEDLEVN